MELQTGLPLLMQQYRALVRKNMILSWRNRRSTIAQLVSPLVFLFLLFLFYRAATPSGGSDVRDPVALVSPPIPPCEDKFLIRRPCFDFVWSGDESAKIASIVRRIMENNPGRVISPKKVKSFKTKKEVDDWLFSNPLRTPGALHFEETSETVISYGVQTNSTQYPELGHMEDPTFKFQIPLHVAAEREIARSLLGDSNYSWIVGFKEFPHPALEISADDVLEDKYLALSTLSPVFFIAIALFSFVFQISSLVIEKELKLREAMKLMGLYDTAYWLSWLTWEAILALTSSLLILITGMAFHIPIFLKNNFGIVFLLFFLFQMNMIAFAFMLSTIIRKSSSATTLGFFIFIVSFVGQIFGTIIKASKVLKSFKRRFIWALFPPNILSNGLDILIDSALHGSGITWSKLSDCSGLLCMMPMINVYQWFLGIFFFWFILAIYMDNVIPNSSGVRMSVFYFLKPGYWFGSGENKVKEGSIFSLKRSDPTVEFETPDDEDVLEEENAVTRQMMEGLVDPNVAVQIRRLVKKYPGKSGYRWFHYCCICCICCCSKPKKKPDYHAVKGLCVNIQKDQLFCLLGPNGAGKTTTIGCLTGITPVTSGDALVYGHSIRSTSGLSSIQKIMGVCPQFDVLWEALSGEEHLYLFASIKGLPAASIKADVQKSLADVKLEDAAKRRSGSYSGGMKRRLSVAIALIGDPKLVLLDEPTTGMDPISRRHVWDIIENAKKGRAIILTTHSMEEADILSDRIGIMAKGSLRCIGTSIRLKSKFGTGLIINVSFSEITSDNVSEEDTIATSRREAMKHFFRHHLNVVPKQETKYFLSYVIPQNKERLLKSFFTELEEREREFGVADVQLGLTTLEEVFLNVAKKAALENAAVESSMETLTLASGTNILIPVGATHVGIPGTSSPDNPRGLMVDVQWGQDSEGKLCITGHSVERPIPDGVICNATPPTGTLGSNQKGPVHGFVVDI